MSQYYIPALTQVYRFLRMNTDQIPTLENETVFKAIFEFATTGIVVTDRTGKIQNANPHLEKLFGYRHGELINETVEKLIPSALHSKHQKHREDYFAKPKSRPMGLGIDLMACKKDGSQFPVEISLGHFYLNDEIYAVAFVTDISRLREQERDLKEINENLEMKVHERTLELTNALENEHELNEVKSRFVSLASHEFRTPLSAILSSISLIDQYADMGEIAKRKKHIERVKSSVRNLTDILNNFLSLDKLDNKKQMVEIIRFNLQTLNYDIIEELNGILKPGQKIQYSHIGNTEIIQDQKILRNIVLNLLSNAIKYSDENKTITLKSNVDGKTIDIVVKDDGLGIPAKEQKNLFTKFYRASNASNIQGTGLGLNLVKKYIELLDGEISFHSKENEGTTFSIRLESLNDEDNPAY